MSRFCQGIRSVFLSPRAVVVAMLMGLAAVSSAREPQQCRLGDPSPTGGCAALVDAEGQERRDVDDQHDTATDLL